MKSKFGSILLSVAIAFGLWLYVITAVSPGSSETYYDIPVVMAGESVLSEERGLMLTSVSNASVTMRLSGNRSDLSKVNSRNIIVKADLSNIYEPGSNITVNYSISFPGDVPSNAFVIESKNPGTLRVSVARRASKEVPVQVKWIGSAPVGFISDRENRILDIPVVNIVGPDYVVDKIEKAVIDVDLNEQRESISQLYHYTLCDAEDNPVDAELITTNVEEIQLDVKILRVKDVKLVCTLADGGGALASDAKVTIDPATIRVSGSEGALDAMGDEFTVGTINLAEVNKSAEMKFEVVLPEGVTNLTGVNEVTARVSVSGLSTKELVLENIQSINVPEGMKAELFTEKLTVVFRGPSDQIQKLTPKDVSVAVDFAGAEAGTSTYKAVFTFAEGFEEVGALKADPISASVQAS